MDSLGKGERLVLNTLQHFMARLSQIVTWTYLERPNETFIEGIAFSSKKNKKK